MQKRLKQAIFSGAAPAPQKTEPSSPIEKLDSLRREMPHAGYLRQAGVLEIIPISPATLWRWVKNGAFPPPFKLSPRVTAWRLEDLTQWLKKSAA